MKSPELILISLNVVMIFLGYLVIYPRFVGSDSDKLIQSDLVISITSLIIAGYLFWGSDVGFNLLVFDVNWFWFSIVTFLIMELPFAFWYRKKYKVKATSPQ